jgi:hypothetical protein
MSGGPSAISVTIAVAILEYIGLGDLLECPECEALDAWMVKYIDPPTARELLRWPDDDRDKYLE